jgi:hypothetical protein
MKEYKLTRKIIIYEDAIVSAKSKADALRQYEKGKVTGWDENDGSGEDYGLVELAERGKDGYFSIIHGIAQGKIV